MLTEGRYTKRCHRVNIAGHAHELTFSCYRNQPFLREDQTCNFLIDAIHSARNKHGFDLWAYVFMPNHVHLLICPQRSEYSISDILLSIKQPVSRKAIDYLKQHNPDGLKHLATGHQHRPYRFWQKGGGYDRNLIVVNTIVYSVRYIHNNPVRKELVKSPEDWHYSSAGDWKKKGKGPLSIDFQSYPVV